MHAFKNSIVVTGWMRRDR